MRINTYSNDDNTSINNDNIRGKLCKLKLNDIDCHINC